jgi:hypothetical protein
MPGAPEVESKEAADIWRYVVDRTRGASLLCQNVPFDRAMMWEEMRLHGAYGVPHGVGPEEGPWDRSFIEVRKCSSYLQKQNGWKSTSLNPLYEECLKVYGAPPLPHQHRSESDVLRALWVWAHASALQGETSVPEISVKMAVLGWLKRDAPKFPWVDPSTHNPLTGERLPPSVVNEERGTTLPGVLHSVEIRGRVEAMGASTVGVCETPVPTLPETST